MYQGFAYRWFCSRSVLVHLYSSPKTLGRRFKCVKALCARRWVRVSNTQYQDSSSDCSSLSFPFQPAFAFPAVQALLLFHTLLISTLPLPPSPIWMLHAGMTCGHIRGSGRGGWWWLISHHSPDTDMSGGDTEIFEVHLNSAKLLSAGRTCVGVRMCVHVDVCDTGYAHTQ